MQNRQSMGQDSVQIDGAWVGNQSIRNQGEYTQVVGQSVENQGGGWYCSGGQPDERGCSKGWWQSQCYSGGRDYAGGQEGQPAQENVAAGKGMVQKKQTTGAQSNRQGAGYLVWYLWRWLSDELEGLVVGQQR